MNFKYGDVLIKERWYDVKRTGFFHSFRFRIDPVPNIHKIGNYSYFRNIKTTNERRNSYIENDVKIRPKRNKTNLPNSWDDIGRNFQKNWKSFGKRKKQWMK